MKIVKSSGSTERDQDEGQGQGPASSRAENPNASVEDVEESFDKLFAAINGMVIPASVEENLREENKVLLKEMMLPEGNPSNKMQKDE